MEVDLHEPIKIALAKAKEYYERKNYIKCASAYEKAADLMTLYAEQAISREAELRRKKKAIEYREIAKKLRSGEFTPTKESIPQESDTAKEQASAAPEIRAAVSQLIYHSKITWDDIGGLEETKSEIKFALGMTLAKPPDGISIASWTKILFYGPPGTGKTLLAAATSNAIRDSEGVPSVFFNVKISSVLSKYFGESSKIVAELYGLARDTSPAVIFLDEFESICGKRGEFADSGPERRLLSSILSELDGMEQKGRTDIYVLTIAATNRPWDLDPAVISRFEKKIFTPLPDENTRIQILKIHLERKGFQSEVDYTQLAKMTKGFSGREIERFTKQVTSSMIQEMNREIPELVDKGLDYVKKHKIRTRPLKLVDFEQALKLITPQTTPEEMQKYLRWKEYSDEL